MDNSTFDDLVDEALEELPHEFKEELDNVSIHTQELPTREQMAKAGLHHRGLLFGLYEGIPKTKRRHYGIGGPLPDRITIFKYPLIYVSRTKEDLKERVRSTVIHEIGHHFGMSEEEIRRAEARRARKVS